MQIEGKSDSEIIATVATWIGADNQQGQDYLKQKISEIGAAATITELKAIYTVHADFTDKESTIDTKNSSYKYTEILTTATNYWSWVLVVSALVAGVVLFFTLMRIAFIYIVIGKPR